MNIHLLYVKTDVNPLPSVQLCLLSADEAMNDVIKWQILINLKGQF